MRKDSVLSIESVCKNPSRTIQKRRDMKTTLTPEESQRLIDLGVDPKMASTTCINFNGTYAYVSGEESETVRNCVNDQYYTEECKCFSIADFLSILPKEIKIHRDGDTLSMIYHCGQWRVGYTHCAEYCNHTKVAPELIDALNSLLIWVLKNKIIKLKEEI